MLKLSQKFVPVLNSEAGLCLTGANWSELGIDVIAVKLEMLMVKPGLDLLYEIPDLKQYLGWTGDMIINGGDLTANRDGVFTIISSYDGSRLRFSYSDLLQLINQLRPKAVVLPKRILSDYPEIRATWNQDIFPYYSADDIETFAVSYPHGVHYQITQQESSDVIQKRIAQLSERPGYLFGEADLEMIKRFKQLENVTIESDQPARKAMNGQVYTYEFDTDLTEPAQSMNFTKIVDDCQCPTCNQQFTNAYLHHLIRNTPLLCQRFLIQHNVGFIQAKL